MSVGTRFGYTAEQWERMVDAGLAYLEQIAERRSHTDYTTLCREVQQAAGSSPQPGDHALAFLLGDIARRSFDDRGVVITALVHYRNQGFAPGHGFYGICQELGLLPAGTLADEQKTAFLTDHLRALEAAYGRPRRGGSGTRESG